MTQPTLVGTPAQAAVTQPGTLLFKIGALTVAVYAGVGLLTVVPYGVFNPVAWTAVVFGDAPAQTLTLSAATVGSGRTATAGGGTPFAAGDVAAGRKIVTSAGVALITGFTSSTVVTVQITSAFAGTSIASGEWMVGALLTKLTGAALSSANSDGTGEGLDLWYLQNPAVSTATIGVVGSTGQFMGFEACVWQNTHATTPFPDAPITGTRNASGGTSPVALGAVTSTSNDVVLAAAAVLDQLASLAAVGTIIGSSTNESTNTGVSFVTEYYTATSPSPSWTYTAFNGATGNYVAFGVRLQGSVAAAGRRKLVSALMA